MWTAVNAELHQVRPDTAVVQQGVALAGRPIADHPLTVALALDEVKPKFGAPSDQLALYYKNGLVPYGDAFTDVRETLIRVIDQVRSNDKTPLMSVLLHGERGAGKTALATYCAVASEFPLVRMVKASELISRAESGKCSFIYNVFEEAYRSPLSIIILDDIERLIDYVGA